MTNAQQESILNANAPYIHASNGNRNVIIVTLVSRYTQKEADRVTKQLAAKYGEVADVQTVQVVDFIGIPNAFHNYAKKKIAEARRAQPKNCLVVDEAGNWRQKFHAKPDQHVEILVFDRAGKMRGVFHGEAELKKACELISHVAESKTASLPLTTRHATTYARINVEKTA